MSSYAVDTARSRGCAFSMRGALLSSKSVRASNASPRSSGLSRNREKKKGARLRKVSDERADEIEAETDRRIIAKILMSSRTPPKT